MAKRHHTYHLTLEHTAASNPEQPLHQPFVLDFNNHDDIFAILERVQTAGFLPAPEAAQVALGVKLLSEVMLLNREHPLFTELRPAFSEFIKKLKAQNKPATE
jgi:hypothetical protein